MQVDEILTLKATGVTHDGKGVCKNAGLTVFVKGLLQGESALCKIDTLKKNYATAQIVRLIEVSPMRVAADCECFPACGGCDYRHMTYEEELRIKALRVENAFKKIAGTEIGQVEIFPSETEIRNKVSLQIQVNNGDVDYGFFAKKSHNFISCGNCRLISKEMHGAARAFCDFLQIKGVAAENISGFSLRENKDRTQCSLLINVNTYVSFQGLKDFLCKSYVSTACVQQGDKFKVLFGKGFITDILCGNTLNISPLSFYQINPDQAEKAYSLAINGADPHKETVALDLCCGIGSITLFAASFVKKAYGVEIVAEAIENAEENCRLNHIDNALFLCGDASQGVEFCKKHGDTPSLVICDPPRAGLNKKTLDAIIKLAPEKIAYISCDCETQARDVKELLVKGYKILSVKAVDFFKRTAHVESICIMIRDF